MKIPQIAHVTLMDAQTIKIEPRDKNELKHVEKAIYDSGSGLTPQNEGTYVIVRVPALTQDRRAEIAKQEAMKANKAIFDAKEIGEDESKRNEKDIDALVKTMNDKIDELVKNKSDEVMTI